MSLPWSRCNAADPFFLWPLRPSVHSPFCVLRSSPKTARSFSPSFAFQLHFSGGAAEVHDDRLHLALFLYSHYAFNSSLLALFSLLFPLTKKRLYFTSPLRFF